jgi:hypothetical protein
MSGITLLILAVAGCFFGVIGTLLNLVALAMNLRNQ